MCSTQFTLKSVPHVVDLLPPATGCNPAIHLNASFNSAPIAAGLWQEARRGGFPHEYDGLIYFRKSKSATKIWRSEQSFSNLPASRYYLQPHLYESQTRGLTVGNAHTDNSKRCTRPRMDWRVSPRTKAATNNERHHLLQNPRPSDQVARLQVPREVEIQCLDTTSK